jgi:hypothetical protein
MANLKATLRSIPRAGIAAVAAVALAAVTVGPAALASSAPPPTFLPNRLQTEVFATRVAIEPTLEPHAPATWQAEYATSASGPWTVAASDTVDAKGTVIVSLYIGTEAPVLGTIHDLRHLAPNTVYFARFRAKTEAGEAQETVEFKTRPAGRPAIDERENAITQHNGTTFKTTGGSPTSMSFTAQIDTEGAPTDYSFALAPSESGPFTPCATGSISLAEEFADPEVDCTGLAPETRYYTRLVATNEHGETVQRNTNAGGGESDFITTPSAKPIVSTREIRNVTATSAHFDGEVGPNGSETTWRLESATSPSGPWVPVPGASGTVSQAEAEALGFHRAVGVQAELTGLSPSTTYYVRLFAEDKCALGCGEADSGPSVKSFTTSGPPTATTVATHALHGEALRVLGSVNPNSSPTFNEQSIAIEGAPTGGAFTLTFNGQTTAPIPFDAEAFVVQSALTGLPEKPQLEVIGAAGGPYTVVFRGTDSGRSEPQIEGSGSGLTPSGTVAVRTLQQGGEAYDTHYHFEYEAEAGAGAPFASASSTSSLDLGSGNASVSVGQDLPGLTPGESYRFRVFATNNSPGDPIVHGEEQTLTVPNPHVEPQPACENEHLRSGASANLPDCRAYEQITPVDKEGVQNLFKYATSFESGVLPGQDGEHLLVTTRNTRWGTGPDAGRGPYFFARKTGQGWQMTAATPEPEAGVNLYQQQLIDPNLGAFAFESRFETGGATSTAVAFMSGPPGGPYAIAASVPAKQARPGWSAASEDFSKLILAVEDHTLLGFPTHTAIGTDLYEYVAGELHQLNVDSAGKTIGSCGARMATPSAGSGGNRHRLSLDGSRAFFEAVPGSNCSEPAHLYERVDGASTIDLGVYAFLDANIQGTRMLLEKTTGENAGLYLYDGGSGTTKPLPATAAVLGTRWLEASEDLTALYFEGAAGSNTETVFRYDLATETLSPLFSGGDDRLPLTKVSPETVSSDGRYFYFDGGVSGIPGAGLMRYDSAEKVVECVSCSSPFNPEPKFGINDTGGSLEHFPDANQLPNTTYMSADGNYAFFETVSALLPADVNGEVPPEPGSTFKPGTEEFYPRPDGSPSNDVYEWRRDGLHGCAHLEGCLSLITPGTKDGWLVELFGTDASGRDVYFYTQQPLLPQDDDSEGDIYDARIGGGFPETARPVECEGDACSTPFAAPSALTPSSLTFQGAGNPLTIPSATQVHPAPRPRACRKGMIRHKHKCVRKRARKAVRRHHGGHR